MSEALEQDVITLQRVGSTEHADTDVALEPILGADSAEAEVTLAPAFDANGEEADVALAHVLDTGGTEPDVALAEGVPAASEHGLADAHHGAATRRFLTDVIVTMGLASRSAADDALEVARNSGTTPERVLLDSGALNQDGLARALAERYGLQHLDLSSFSVDMSAANLVSSAVAKRYQAIPVAFVDPRTLLVAMADPSNVLAVDDIAIMTAHEVRVAVAAPDDIATLISRLNRLEDVVENAAIAADGEEESEGGEVLALHDTADDAPIVKLVNQLVAQAVERGASDLHLEPDGHEMRVRFRIDGILQEITNVPRRMAGGVISRIKVMSELD